MRKASPPLKHTDWDAIRRQLDKAALALEQIELPLEEQNKILKERAKNLAREGQADQAARKHLDVVEFFLAYERYAIESSWVREVHPLKEITPLPGTPAFVLGIINVRGRIVSVVDLKKFFDLPTRGLADLNRVIIIGDAVMEFGILADSVTRVRQIPADELQPPLPTLTGVRADYLQGVNADGLVVLDVARLLSDPKIKFPNR
jgi:purine-binding chemotaxis protein CheW